MNQPSYKEVVEAFGEYLANSSIDGEPRLPREGDIERALAVLSRTGLNTPYFDWRTE